MRQAGPIPYLGGMDTKIVKGLRGVRLDRVFDALEDAPSARTPRPKRQRPALVLRFLPTV